MSEYFAPSMKATSRRAPTPLQDASFAKTASSVLKKEEANATLSKKAKPATVRKRTPRKKSKGIIK